MRGVEQVGTGLRDIQPRFGVAAAAVPRSLWRQLPAVGDQSNLLHVYEDECIATKVEFEWVFTVVKSKK